jgi:colanic acid/amylovoran biosynthesis glycosyltransferase
MSWDVSKTPASWPVDVTMTKLKYPGNFSYRLHRRATDYLPDAWRMPKPYTYRERREVSRWIAEQDITAVMIEYLTAAYALLPLFAEHNVSIVAHAHGVDVSRALLDSRWPRRYRRLAARAEIVAVSRTSSDRLRDIGIPREKLHVVPCGPEIPPERDRQDGTGPVRFVAVGRMVPKKAPLTTLKAFTRCLIDGADITLDMVGDGPLLAGLEAYVDENKLGSRVRLHGALDHASALDLIRSGDVFLQHSVRDPVSGDEEGLPVAVLEAMAAGLPVVSTYHGGIAEAVEHQRSGLLVREGDEEGMAHSVACLAAERSYRRDLGAEARKRIALDFSWERERESLLRLLGLDRGA